MTDDVEFKVMGEISLRSGPGFATPLFATQTSNRLWLQSINDDDLISAFVVIAEDARLSIEHLQTQSRRRRGDKAFFIYRDSEHGVHVDTRDALRARLYDDYTKISDLPYLRRSIARFIGDKRLFNQSNDAISQRERGRQRDNSHASLAFNARFIDVADVARMFIRRHPIDDIVSDALAGVNLIILGRRGDGKTVSLRFVQQELRTRNFNTLYLSGSPLVSLILNLIQKAAGEIISKEDRVDTQEIESLVLEASFNRTDQDRLSSRIERSFSSILMALASAKPRVAVLIDDFEIFAPGPDNMGLHYVLRHLLDAGVQFVLAGDRVPRDLGMLQIGADVKVYELGPLSADEVASLIRSWSQSRNSDDLQDLSAFQAASLLTGFNFREVIQILNATGGPPSTEQDIRKAIGGHFERILTSELWNTGEGVGPETNAALALILDKAGLESGGITESEGRAVATDGNSKVLLRALERLVAIGVLTRAQDRYMFAHRLIEEWWRDRRRLNEM
jgi:hypothetical protein